MYGMPGILEQLLGGAVFGDLAQVHDGDSIAHQSHHAEVVADEEIGETAFLLQFVQEVEDLRLHRHVEGAGRLVEDDELRIERQGPGDGDPLPLTSGELVWEAVEMLPPEADALQQLDHPLGEFPGPMLPCTPGGDVPPGP